MKRQSISFAFSGVGSMRRGTLNPNRVSTYSPMPRHKDFSIRAEGNALTRALALPFLVASVHLLEVEGENYADGLVLDSGGQVPPTVGIGYALGRAALVCLLLSLSERNLGIYLLRELVSEHHGRSALADEVLEL